MSAFNNVRDTLRAVGWVTQTLVPARSMQRAHLAAEAFGAEKVASEAGAKAGRDFGLGLQHRQAREALRHMSEGGPCELCGPDQLAELEAEQEVHEPRDSRTRTIKLNSDGPFYHRNEDGSLQPKVFTSGDGAEWTLADNPPPGHLVGVQMPDGTIRVERAGQGDADSVDRCFALLQKANDAIQAIIDDLPAATVRPAGSRPAAVDQTPDPNPAAGSDIPISDTLTSVIHQLQVLADMDHANPMRVDYLETDLIPAVRLLAAQFRADGF